MYQTKDRQITNFGKESIHCGVVNIDKISPTINSMNISTDGLLYCNINRYTL